MIPIRLRVIIVLGAVLAVVLQATIAPAMTIGYAVPNFILAYVVVVAIVRADSAGLVMPFILGLVYDLLGSGPVGAMAFICVAATASLSWLRVTFDNGTTFFAIVLLVLGMFVCDILYGVLMIACGMDVGLLDSIVYRSLPCGIYDTVLGLIFLPALFKLVEWGASGPVRTLAH